MSLVTRIQGLRGPAIIRTGLVLPLPILEPVNRRLDHEDFPLLLFGLLEPLPLGRLLLLKPSLSRLRVEPRTSASRFVGLAGIVLCVHVGWLWPGVVLDQLPCLLGIPLCD